MMQGSNLFAQISQRTIIFNYIIGKLQPLLSICLARQYSLDLFCAVIITLSQSLLLVGFTAIHYQYPVHVL